MGIIRKPRARRKSCGFFSDFYDLDGWSIEGDGTVTTNGDLSPLSYGTAVGEHYGPKVYRAVSIPGDFTCTVPILFTPTKSEMGTVFFYISGESGSRISFQVRDGWVLEDKKIAYSTIGNGTDVMVVGKSTGSFNATLITERSDENITIKLGETVVNSGVFSERVTEISICFERNSSYNPMYTMSVGSALLEC